MKKKKKMYWNHFFKLPIIPAVYSDVSELVDEDEKDETGCSLESILRRKWDDR